MRHINLSTLLAALFSVLVTACGGGGGGGGGGEAPQAPSVFPTGTYHGHGLNGAYVVVEIDAAGTIGFTARGGTLDGDVGRLTHNDLSAPARAFRIHLDSGRRGGVIARDDDLFVTVDDDESESMLLRRDDGRGPGLTIYREDDLRDKWLEGELVETNMEMTTFGRSFTSALRVTRDDAFLGRIDGRSVFASAPGDSFERVKAGIWWASLTDGATGLDRIFVIILAESMEVAGVITWLNSAGDAVQPMAGILRLRDG